MQRILVLGAGFAGLWSAIGAARRLDQLGIGPDRIEVTVGIAPPGIRSESATTKRISTRLAFHWMKYWVRSASTT